MTIKEFYQLMDIDSEGIVARFATEERVKKYLGKLLEDKTYQSLVDALAKKDYEQAFFAVHTLKGIAANLDLKPLYQTAHALTELLRGQKDPDEAALEALYQELQENYEHIVMLIPLVL